MTDREERTAFTALVLSGIWMLARCILATTESRGSARHIADGWRAYALEHMDVIGQQTDEAKKYRREVTFPSMFR